MTDLIQRLQEAEEGSRELDRKIALHLGWRYTISATSDPDIEFFAEPGGQFRSADSFWPPNWSTSIDAALTLVPEPTDLRLEVWRGGGTKRIHARAQVGGILEDAVDSGTTDSPALAMCIAALKARDIST